MCQSKGGTILHMCPGERRGQGMWRTNQANVNASEWVRGHKGIQTVPHENK